MSVTTILNKLYTREFPLILCEIWGRAYRNFLGHDTKTFPFYTFVIKDFLVEAYVNPALHNELDILFANKVKENPEFFKEFNNEFLKRYEELKKTWEHAPLSNSQLLTLITDFRDFWPAIYASMYIAGHDFSQADQDLMLNLRKQIDKAADELTHAIVLSLQAMCPDLGHLVNYVSIENLSREMPNKEELIALSHKTVVIFNDRIIPEDEFNSLKKQYNFDLESLELKKETKEFSGQIACKGKIRGTVRLVLKRDQVTSLQAGEVLVSTMTVPDYLPAMSKAVAFITDEGGITCHAAIIAREMKKPCVIGTKVATKVLKNGDMVEVDADQGIIRILN
jgi:phosphohistidine swiveling domain-containing protein